jgi:hypothetical protein
MVEPGSVADPSRVDFAAPGAGTPDLSALSLGRLREALRAPDVPVPFPSTLGEAARRVRDLADAERFEEARYIVRTFEGTRGAPRDQLAFARAGVLLALRGRSSEDRGRAFSLLVNAFATAGHVDEARAAADVLAPRLEVPPSRPGSREGVRGPARAASRDAGDPDLGAHGRRARSAAVPPAVRAVARGIELPFDPTVPLAREVNRFESALASAEAIHAELLEDPRPELTVRLAQALEAAGRPQQATTHALDVLDLVDRIQGTDPSWTDPSRSEVAAHAVLGRTLQETRSVLSAQHAVQALLDLHTVDDPPLRVGLITGLLRALVLAGLAEQASFTAGRLVALQRTLVRDADRVPPLLAVASQRISVQRFDAALVPLEEAQEITRRTGDRRGGVEAARMLARLHQEAGDLPDSLAQLQRVAHDARWIVDDLETSGADRRQYAIVELNAESLSARFAQELGEIDLAESAANAVLRRTDPRRSLDALGAAALWDFEVDARVTLMIAAGLRLADEGSGITVKEYAARRTRALAAIGRAGVDDEERARYWGTYLDDRHAVLLASRGDLRKAVRVGEAASSGWASLGMTEEQERLSNLVTGWKAEL